MNNCFFLGGRFGKGTVSVSIRDGLHSRAYSIIRRCGPGGTKSCSRRTAGARAVSERRTTDILTDVGSEEGACEQGDRGRDGQESPAWPVPVSTLVRGNPVLRSRTEQFGKQTRSAPPETNASIPGAYPDLNTWIREPQ